MSEAPKKIWMTENPEAWTTRDDMFNTPYIRADIVDELVEALEGLMTYAGIIEERCDEYETSRAKAALKKMEESHD